MHSSHHAVVPKRLIRFKSIYLFYGVVRLWSNIIRMMKSRRMSWAGHVARMGQKRNPYKLLVGKPEGKRPLGRSRRRWVDNIRIHLGEIRWDGTDWIDLAQDNGQWRAVVNTVMNLRVS
jgi:hypothetical protein